MNPNSISNKDSIQQACVDWAKQKIKNKTGYMKLGNQNRTITFVPENDLKVTDRLKAFFNIWPFSQKSVLKLINSVYRQQKPASVSAYLNEVEVPTKFTLGKIYKTVVQTMKEVFGGPQGLSEAQSVELQEDTSLKDQQEKLAVWDMFNEFMEKDPTVVNVFELIFKNKKEIIHKNSYNIINSCLHLFFEMRNLMQGYRAKPYPDDILKGEIRKLLQDLQEEDGNSIKEIFGLSYDGNVERLVQDAFDKRNDIKLWAYEESFDQAKSKEGPETTSSSLL